jgi:hypothetical protein
MAMKPSWVIFRLNFWLCRFATDYLNRVLAPDGELLFFVWPKKSNPKKCHPDAALILRSSLLNGVDKRGSCPFANAMHPCIAPIGLFRSKAPVLGAAYGRKTVSKFEGISKM